MHFEDHHPRYSKTPLLACRVQWYGCLGCHQRNQTTFFGIVHFKHPRPRYPKTLMLANRVPRYGCLARHPGTRTIFFGIVHFKHPHPRYPKSSFLVYGVQRCVGVLCISNTPILGIQKHFCWPMGYSGMGVWSATPEPTHYFLALSIANTFIPGIQQQLFWRMVCTGMGATPEPKQYF